MFLVSKRPTAVVYAVALQRIRVLTRRGEAIHESWSVFVALLHPALKAEREGLIRVGINDDDGLPDFSPRTEKPFRSAYHRTYPTLLDRAAFGIRALDLSEESAVNS